MQVSATTSSSTQQALLLAANQLSSGKRITSAAVDPAGLAIANALTAQANGATQTASNAQNAIDANTVTQGDTLTISNAAQQLQTLSVAANNGLLSAGDRADVQAQTNQTTQEINSVAATPVASPDLSSSASAAASESSTAAAAATISSSQVALGAQTAALGFEQQNSAIAANNLSASASSIGDADVTRTATSDANAQVASHIQIALQVQANLAVSSLLGLFPH
jgi:flagellin